MVKPYRIKHKDSGYFYQRYNGSNLGKVAPYVGAWIETC